MLTVLVVEDEALIRMALAMMLVDGGYEVCGPVVSAEAAFREVAICKPDIALVDVSIRGSLNGLELAKELTAMGVPCVVMSAHATRCEAEAAGAVAWLAKPSTGRAVLAAVGRAAMLATSRAQSRGLPEALSALRASAAASNASTRLQPPFRLQWSSRRKRDKKSLGMFQQGANGAQEISASMGGVNQAAATGTAAAQVLNAASGLPGEAEKLRSE